jgi:hypothetical protein
MDHNALRDYEKRWVAVLDDGSVLADANDLDALLTRLAELPAAKASIQRVPAADEPLFVGLR